MSEEIEDTTTSTDDNTEDRATDQPTGSKDDPRKGLVPVAEVAQQRQKRHDAEARAEAAEARVKELERANMSEAEKARAEFAEAVQLAQELKAENTRLREGAQRSAIEREFELPAGWGSRLTGSNEDELKEDAARMKADLDAITNAKAELAGEKDKKHTRSDAGKTRSKPPVGNSPDDTIREAWRNMKTSWRSAD